MIIGGNLMEIRSNINEMTKKADNYGIFKKRMQSIKYICWYLKILLDSGYNELDNLGNEIAVAKEAINHNDINLSNQIQSKEHIKV